MGVLLALSIQISIPWRSLVLKIEDIPWATVSRLAERAEHGTIVKSIG